MFDAKKNKSLLASCDLLSADNLCKEFGPRSGPGVITKFQQLIKVKYRQLNKFLALSLSDVVFIMLINFKMPTIFGILTFMSRINFILS